MTKAEIIRKLAKKVGIQDLDAKIFFEVFLRKVYLKLNPGESIKIKNFGYFQIRKGKINNTSASDSEPILADLVVFYPSLNDQQESLENLIFNIPGKKEEEFNVIDSYFSLSFGKPIIPLKDANKSEYFIPPAGNELRRLFDSKADKLLQEGEVTDNFTKEDEILLINSELFDPNQIEINWDEIDDGTDSSEKVAGRKEQSKIKESGALTWEFGDELEKQIEEEALLDTENEDNFLVDYSDFKEISWDFGESLSTNKELSQHSESVDETSKEPDKFERVKSSISGFNIDHKNTLPVDHVAKEDSDLIKSINEELNEEGFAEIKYLPRNYKIESDIFEKSDNDANILKTNDDENEYSYEKVLNPEQMPPSEISIKTNGSSGYSKRKGLGIYVLFSLIIVIGIAVFVYLRFVSPYYYSNKKEDKAKTSAYNTPPVILERDYEIPITYPYPKNNNITTLFDPVDKGVFDQLENGKNNDSINTNLNHQENTIVPEKQLAKTNIDNNVLAPVIKVKDFIYKSGDKFLVQISAWSSEKNAIKHASYFKEKGYQTEIVKVNLNSGVWYRVRVINFHSENEAEKFYNKYK